MRTARSLLPAPRAAAVLAMGAGLVLTGCSDAGTVTASDPRSSAPSSSSPTPGSAPTTASPAPSASTPSAGAPGASPGAATASAVPTGSSTGVAVGEVVEGFPLDVVPVLPEAEVTLSDVEAQDGGGRTVALAGRTSRSPEEVVAFYTQALTGQGFTATTPPDVEGALVTTYARGGAAELLTLSITSSDGVQDFSIGGQIA